MAQDGRIIPDGSGVRVRAPDRPKAVYTAGDRWGRSPRLRPLGDSIIWPEARAPSVFGRMRPLSVEARLGAKWLWPCVVFRSKTHAHCMLIYHTLTSPPALPLDLMIT